MPKVVSSFASLSRPGKSKSAPLKFENGWNVGPVFDWYNGLANDPRAKSIQAIQIRKDVSGPVPHRFIVLRMCDKLVHRFDRRPDRGPNVDTTMVDLIFNQAVASQDSYTREISLADEERFSEREIELTLNGQVDLLTVISVCYAISVDNLAQKYTFLRHNCFFFSWTILTIVSRYHLPYEVPLPRSVMDRFNSRLEGLTSLIVNEATALFLDLVIDTVVIFRDRARASMPEGMGLMGRAGSAFPTGLLRFLWRRLFKIRLRFGLCNKLAKMVKAEVTRAVSIVHEATLSNHVARELLDKHLWIEGTRGDFKEALKTEMIKILWKFVLEAISGGLGDVEPKHLQGQLTDPELNFTWLGRNVAELCTVWNAALQSGLWAARQAGQDIEGLSHNDAFDKAWDAARGAALTAAQNAVDSTREVMHKPERDAKWAAIWRIWEDCWKEAHDVAQPKSVQTVERIVEEILAAGTGVVIQEMKESRVKTIQASIPNKASFLQCRKQISNLTNAQLQECMQGIIQKNTVSAEALDAVQSSMERIWETTRQHLQAPAALLNTIAEHNSEAAQ
ncbi:hypothetical protein FRC10_008037 [Ceratobasidium sp. 414]|nr:hypothetical protein FRC10_008037 [Ceratobasidium sp. 414]